MSVKGYKVQIENIFEGPIDLLFYLIKENKVNIYDIPIGVITEQYLKYIEFMKSMNIDIAGDFILIASSLVQIKSKMLLPIHEQKNDDQDPLSEITAPLEEYFSIKSVAQLLAERKRLGEDTFVRNTSLKDLSIEPEQEMIQVGLFELVEAFQKIMKNLSPEQRVQLTAESISVKERIYELVELLESKTSATFDELFSNNAKKDQIIVTFLALLEMVKVSLIQIVQHVQTGVMRVFYLNHVSPNRLNL